MGPVRLFPNSSVFIDTLYIFLPAQIMHNTNLYYYFNTPLRSLGTNCSALYTSPVWKL